MPVTIGTLVSKVNVVEPNSLLSPEMVDQIVRLVAAHVREQLRAEEESHQNGQIPDRNSNVETFE